jgi:DNA primase
MFPIFNSYDKVIGFGARVLDKGQMPKYLNSSDSVVFSKGKNLYGLNWAKKAILDKDRVIIVEGYTDCIRAHEKGFSETVATLGTALTAEQARALKRYTKNFVLIYDADEAGELAALRNLDVLLSEDITPKIAVLPAGSDPDNFLNEKNLASFEKIIDEARNIFDYKLQQLLERYKVDNAEDKTIIAHEFLPTISAIPDKVTQSDYIRRLAEKLDIKEDHLLFELNKVSKTGNKNRHKIFTNQQNAIDLAEKILLVIMLEDNSFIGRVKEEVDINDCVSDAVRPIYSKVFELYEIKQKVEPASLMNELDSDELRTLIASVFMDTPEIKDKEKNFNDCIKAIKIKTIDLKLKKIKIKQKDAQLKKMHDAVAELLKEANALIKEKIKLTKK